MPALDAGLNLSRSPLLLHDAESADLLNVELDQNSIKNARGAIKFNNQVAPKSGILLAPDPAFSPLSIEAGRSVPLRGYGFLPYDPNTDIGGDFVSNGAALGSETFHERRGGSFNFEVSFRIPQDVRLYSTESRGSGAPAEGAGDTYFEENFGYDEALDETVVIIQKGGDRLAPMSWFLGVTNVGGQAPSASTTGFEKLTGADPGERPSNYALVFGWFDQAGWAEGDNDDMRYDLADPSASATGSYSTVSLRALITKHFVEPGKNYHVGVQLKVDSAAISAGSWNDDGNFKITMSEELGAPVTHDITHAGGGSYTENGVYAWRGPTDSGEYLIKYGIRYSSKDPVFLGLGFRMSPWKDLGFIPFGSDSSPMEHGGFVMVDRSSVSTANLYSGVTYDLTINHPASQTYVEFDHRGLVNGRADDGNQSPTGPDGAIWQGLTGGNFNSEALRGYRLVFPTDSGDSDLHGGIITMDTYSEPTGATPPFRMSFVGTNTLKAFAAGNHEILVQAFRWNQRPLILSEARFYSTQRDYTDARTQFSLRSEALLDDRTEPDVSRLVARYPMDDAGGGVLRESVRGNDGYLCPFALGVSESGTRGSSQLFLSGEGEALVLDLSENPVFLREFERMQRSGEGAFAVEITCILPQAYYAIDETVGSSIRGKFAPHLASWELRDPENDEFATQPEPLMLLTHRAQWGLAESTVPVRRPMGFAVAVGTGSDQEASGLAFVPPAFSGGVLTWDGETRWVGKRITIQAGVQSTGTEDQYDVYFVAKSARDVIPQDLDDDQGDQEVIFRSTLTLRKKDLVRSVITIGGCWDAKRLANGYTEANARIILDEVRVFGAAAPGTLGADSSVLTTMDGKLSGPKAYPERALTVDDLLRPIGEGLETANVTDGSVIVSSSGNTAIHEAEPEATLRATKETFLLISGDPFQKLEVESVGEEIEEFYAVESVASGGASLTLHTPFDGSSRDNALARSFRLIGYTNFEDDVRDLPLTLGRGDAYTPGTSTVEDATLTLDYFANPCPVSTDWKFRVYSPIGSSSPAQIIPRWVRGCQSPRRNPILGAKNINERVLMATKGSLFEVDDRWRPSGPTDSLTESLELLAGPLGDTDLLLPDEGDVVRYADARSVQPSTSTLNGNTWIYDCWVYPVRSGLYQTILWVGDEGTDPQEDAGDGHDLHLWIRLHFGRPQICLGFSGTLDGTEKPDKGLMVGEGSIALQPNRWTHLRWNVYGLSSGTVIGRPKLQVNGKVVSVQVNGRENGLSGSDEWFSTSNLVADLTDVGWSILLGAAHDSHSYSVENVPFAEDELKGLCFRPDRFNGLLHGLGGRLADVVVATTTGTLSSPVDFDPHNIDYTVGTVFFRSQAQEGIGHKILDTHDASATADDQYGVIHAHPFVSRFHEMEASGNRVNFEIFGNEVFVANGARVVVEEEGEARFAGVPDPTSAPDFEVVRSPLWIENSHATDPEGNADTGIAATATDNGPVGAASIDDQQGFFHYNTRGNAHLSQAFSSEITWEKQGIINPASPAKRSFICVKGYVRMRSVSGRVVLWSQKDSLRSGRSLEIRDGKLGFYWWDPDLKKEVGIETSTAVIETGFVHYVYLRKEFPQRHESHGNWISGYFLAGKGRRLVLDNISGTFQVGEQITAAGSREGTIIRLDTRSDVTSAAGNDVVIVDYVHTGSSEFVDNDAVTGGTSSATGDVFGTPGQVSTDSMVVRRFRKEDTLGFAANTVGRSDFSTIEAVTNESVDFSGGSAGTNVRPAIGFPTSDNPAPSGTTATGCVTDPATLYRGTATGLVQMQNLGASAHGVFSTDMLGMIWQWTSTVASNLRGLYRVVQVNSTTEMKVADFYDGTIPDFSSISSDTAGGVFIGVNLVKTTDFDNSKDIDEGNYDVSWMGHPLQGNPQSGVSPFDGETWSFGWCAESPVDGYEFFENARTDMTETGTDHFDGEIYSALASPGPLLFDATNAEVFTGVDPETAAAADYATTQPNADLEVANGAGPGTSLFWRILSTNLLLEGETKVWVTFFDPRNNVESRPSPELLVEPGGEDVTNPSGDASLKLKGIPVFPGAFRRIYLSLLDEVDGFRVAEIPDDTSSSLSIRKTQDEISRGFPLRFDRGSPPRCSLLAVSQSEMFYGKLDGQPDGIQFSNPFTPNEVPPANFFVIDSGDDKEITALGDLQGALAVWKRNAIWRVTAAPGVDAAGNAIPIVTQQRLTTGAGAISQQSVVDLDNTKYWLDVRGPMSFGGTGKPVYLGSKLEPYFRDTADSEGFVVAAAAINRFRSQYVFVLKAAASDYQHDRFAFEFDHELSGIFADLGRQALHRITFYRDPNLTALTEVDSRDGGPRRLVGGTEEGFAVWLDQSATTLVMLGDTAAVHGDNSLAAGASSTTTKLILSGSPNVDVDLEGPRGARVRWLDGTANAEAVVLFAESLSLHLDRVTSSTLPASGAALTLGEKLYLWKSKAFPFGNPGEHKKLYWVDLIRVPKASGSLKFDLFHDLATAAFSFSTARTLDLTSATEEIGVGEAQFRKIYQVQLSTDADDSDVEFELLDLSFRVGDTDNR